MRETSTKKKNRKYHRHARTHLNAEPDRYRKQYDNQEIRHVNQEVAKTAVFCTYKAYTCTNIVPQNTCHFYL